ncbi:MAG: papain-like cysteine peptidase [Rickettsiales bacterium]|jgi:hypothetical protein|nr:papain-like cysteine peptidase [Rickettsiales bacterium]
MIRQESGSSRAGRMLNIFINIVAGFVPGCARRAKFRQKMELGIIRCFYALKKMQCRNLGEKYEFIYSLGEACFIAHTIKYLGLRKCSGPFDWIFGGTFKSRTDVFLDDFRRWFDKEDLKPRFEYSKWPGNEAYENIYTGLFLNHDFREGYDFDAEYTLLREKYDRRTARMLENMKKSKRVLLCYFECQPTEDYPGYRGADDAAINDFLARANKKYGGKIDLLYLRHDSEMPVDHYEIKQENAHLYLARYRAVPLGAADPDKIKCMYMFDMIFKILKFTCKDSK